MASITITITDQAAYRVVVTTDADKPVVGRGVTPAEALAIDLLQGALKQGATVIYDASQVPLVALALDLLDPEMFGHAVTQEVRNRAKRTLGPRMGQLVPQHLTSGVDIDAVYRKRPMDARPVRARDLNISTVPHPDGPITLAQLAREDGRAPPRCTRCGECGGEPA